MDRHRERGDEGGRNQADRLDINLNIKLDPAFASVLGGLATTLASIERKIDAMQAAMEKVAREVAETKTIQESAITLIEGIAQQIRDNAGNVTKLNQLADDLDASANALAAKVQENTPTPPPSPPPA